MSSLSRKLKRNISSYYDASSFSSLGATLTDISRNSSARGYFNHETAQERDLGTSEDGITTPSTETPLPFRPSMWRAPTSINVRSVTATDLERGMSVKSNYFMNEDPAGRPAVNYHSELTRDNSIATAISMRRADIMVSRDNPQNLHQEGLSGIVNSDAKEDDEVTVNSTTVENTNSDPHHSHHHAVAEKDTLLFEKKKSVIILLGRLLIKCGCPFHRVDEILQHSSKIMALDASFSFLPDSILITFTNADDTESIMVKAPQGFDNGKMARISSTMNNFYRGEIDLDRCLVMLHEVATSPPTCGIWSTIIFFTASSFTASALMFKGTWIDAGLSSALGLMVAILYIISGYFPIYARVFEISASVFVAIVTRALHNYVCFTGVAMSSILILLPGYTMTVGVMELSARHVTTGIVRLVYAVFYAFQLAYGLQVGTSMYNAIDPSAPEDGLCGQNLVNPYFYILLLPILSVALSLSYGSSKKQYISQLISSTIAFTLSYFLGKVIPDGQIVGTLASFAVGLYSNLALKITGEPPLVSLCVGATLLVPGSIGVRGAYSVLHQSDTNTGFFPLQMLTIALGLSAGIFAADMIIYPSGKRRSIYISL